MQRQNGTVLMRDNEKTKEQLITELKGLRLQIRKLQTSKSGDCLENAIRQEYTRDLDLRVKELNCLYSISAIVNRPGISLAEILRESINLIPSSLQYPEETRARIILEGQKFETPNFQETGSKHAADILVNGHKTGVIEVFCSKENPGGDEGPFLEEEKKLISAITQQIGRITERKNVEDTLQLAFNEISSLIQNVTQNIDYGVRFYNPNLKKCHEIKNCNKDKCPCHGRDVMRCWQIVGTYCGGEAEGSFAQKIGDCSKCKVFQQATSDPIYQLGEQFNNMMTILEGKNSELQQAYAELQKSHSKILQQEKMASIGQLAAGVAHEINNPMGFISSNLGTLRKYAGKLGAFIRELSDATGQLNSEGAEDRLKERRKQLKIDYILEDIEPLILESLEGAERVKRIVQNLKSFSRVDQAEYKHVNIIECIESTLNIVWNELKYKTTIEKEYGEIPLTKCYPQQLNQVFMNLLVNASQAIEKQGVIKIKTWNGDGMINVSISDTGHGIPEEKVGKIFDPFFTTKGVGKGTGLGLSICYEIVEKHNGEITVNSKTGEGTTFTVKIPVVEGK